MKTILSPIFFLIAISQFAFSQDSKQAFYYCIDHPNKTIYHSTGKAVVKKKLEDKDFYQYGFMKRMGWINKSWEGLEYGIHFINQNGRPSLANHADSLKTVYRLKGYAIKPVPMPYPMKPFEGYRKDGKN